MKTTILAPFAAIVSVALIGCLSGCPDKGASTGGAGTSTSSAGATVDPAKAATINGKIKFEGTPPAATEIDMSGTAECHAQHKDAPQMTRAVLVKNGMLQNVVVSVKDGLTGSFKAPDAAVTLDQKGCLYIPHVSTIMVGQKLDIKNSDPTLHNIHSLPKKNDVFNIAMPKKDEVLTRTFKSPEMVKFRCDVHGWMSCYVGVFDHPFSSVSGEDGSFELKGLPPGEYTIEAWHEKLGTQEQKVKVGEKETKSIEFTFKAS